MAHVIFATLILAVALVLSTQMICTTWRDVRQEEHQTRIAIAEHIHPRS